MTIFSQFFRPPLRWYHGLIFLLVVNFLTFSWVFTDVPYYNSLNKPFFAPPSWIFGIVWPINNVLVIIGNIWAINLWFGIKNSQNKGKNKTENSLKREVQKEVQTEILNISNSENKQINQILENNSDQEKLQQKTQNNLEKSEITLDNSIQNNKQKFQNHNFSNDNSNSESILPKITQNTKIFTLDKFQILKDLKKLSILQGLSWFNYIIFNFLSFELQIPYMFFWPTFSMWILTLGSIYFASKIDAETSPRGFWQTVKSGRSIAFTFTTLLIWLTIAYILGFYIWQRN